jgi:hypothetical protein
MLVKKNAKATLNFFSCRIVPALKRLQTNLNGPLYADDGDKHHDPERHAAMRMRPSSSSDPQ